MKEILHQLLDAENSGRQAARARQAEAMEILRLAHARAATIAEESRERVNRDLAELEQRVRQEIAGRQGLIAKHADMRIDEIRRAAQQHGTAAVDHVVALLLGE